MKHWLTNTPWIEIVKKAEPVRTSQCLVEKFATAEQQICVWLTLTFSIDPFFDYSEFGEMAILEFDRSVFSMLNTLYTNNNNSPFHEPFHHFPSNVWMMGMLSKTIVTHSCESLGMHHYSLIPSHCIQGRYWETFNAVYICSCWISQFFRSKNRLKGDQFFHQMFDFCENCNPHTTKCCFGEWLVYIWFAETVIILLCLYFQRFLLVWDGVLLQHSIRQFEHAILYDHMQKMAWTEFWHLSLIIKIHSTCAWKMSL